jgi:hypothetical protein
MLQAILDNLHSDQKLMEVVGVGMTGATPCCASCDRVLNVVEVAVTILGRLVLASAAREAECESRELLAFLHGPRYHRRG